MKTRNERLKELFNDTRYLNEYIDINSVLNTEYYNEITSTDELYSVLCERINEVEIIYYSTAMEILKEEDQSLTESLNLAHELSYTPENLNSEILATLLIHERCIDELNDFIQEVEQEEIFND